jgi:hypothetical protein
MKRQLAHMILATCLIAAAAGMAVAQTDADLSRLRDFIARNAELLDQARELVSTTSSIKARQSLEAATKLHRESVAQLNASSGGNLSRAATIARKAREVILQTVALAKHEAKLEESATRAIERASDRLEQARQLRNNRSNTDMAAANKLIEEAYTQLNRSRDNLREHLFEVSLRLAVSSEQLSSRAMTIIKRGSTDVGMAESEIAKTERLIERVGDRVATSGTPQVRQMFEEAVDLQTRAKQAYRSKQPGVAIELTQQSRRLAMRATKIYTSQANPENVAPALRFTDTLLGEARAIAAERKDDGLRRKVERAEQLQREAKQQFDAGDNDRALRLTLRAREVLRDALDSIKGEIGRNDVEPPLKGTDKFLRRVGEIVSRSDDELARDLLARARAKQETAWQAFRDSEFRNALANTRLARRLGNQALRQLGYEDL